MIVVWRSIQIGVVRPGVNESAGIVNRSTLRGRPVNARGQIFDPSNTTVVAYATREDKATIARVVRVIREVLNRLKHSRKANQESRSRKAGKRIYPSLSHPIHFPPSSLHALSLAISSSRYTNFDASLRGSICISYPFLRF